MSLAACHTEDPSRRAMRARLKQESRLTPDEIRTFFDQIAPVIAHKRVTVKEGALDGRWTMSSVRACWEC